MTPATAALVLVAATVIVGAVGYVVLSVVASDSTATTNSAGCTPASSPTCAHSGSGGASPGELIAYSNLR